jgi:hypothetical protein
MGRARGAALAIMTREVIAVRKKTGAAYPGRGDGSAKRLRDARRRAGFETARQAALRMSCNITTYHQHENGVRPITERAAKLYGQFFGVAAGEILYGERLQTQPAILIVGELHADGWAIPSLIADGEGAAMRLQAPSLVQWYSRSGWRDFRASDGEQPHAGHRFIKAPPGMTSSHADRLAALTIGDDAMAPLFIRNDTLLYDPTEKPAKIKRPTRCVVLTRAGALTAGMALRTQANTVILMACGDMPERTITQVVGCWAVQWIGQAAELLSTAPLL